MKENPVRRLVCCVCGDITNGRQWWNRDDGFGICHVCAEEESRRLDDQGMINLYGESGIHYIGPKGGYRKQRKGLVK